MSDSETMLGRIVHRIRTELHIDCESGYHDCDRDWFKSRQFQFVDRRAKLLRIPQIANREWPFWRLMKIEPDVFGNVVIQANPLVFRIVEEELERAGLKSLLLASS